MLLSATTQYQCTVYTINVQSVVTLVLLKLLVNEHVKWHSASTNTASLTIVEPSGDHHVS